MRASSAYLAAIKSERVTVQYNIAGTTPQPPQIGKLKIEVSESRNSNIKKRVLHHLSAELGFSESSFAFAPGCSQALFHTLAAITSPGDGILIETPTYEPFLACAKFLGLKSLRFRRTGNFDLDIQTIKKLAVKGVKAILISNPACPSGHIFSSKELEKLAELGPQLIVDEIYLPLFLDGRISLLNHPDAVHISGLSKSTGLSSARFGWIRTRPTLIEKIDLIALNQNVDMPTVCFQIADTAFRMWKLIIDPALENIRKNHRQIEGLPLLSSSKGSFACLRIPSNFISAPQFVSALKRKSVWVRSGHWFEAPQTVRLGLVGPKKEFREAISIIRKYYD